MVFEAIFELLSLDWRNNHFFYRLLLTSRLFVLDFPVTPNIRLALCEEPMRLLRLYRAFMTPVRPIIRSADWIQLRACGSHQKAETPEPGFTGPK
jgi:hypothetical protein